MGRKPYLPERSTITLTMHVALKVSLNVIRMLSAGAIAVWAFGLIPLYGAPFGGCEHSGFTTPYLACSSWPEFFRGTLFVLPFAMLTPSKWKLPLVAGAALLVVALLGGADSLKTQQYLPIVSPMDLFWGFYLGYPLFLGGSFVVVMWLGFSDVVKDASGDVRS